MRTCWFIVIESRGKWWVDCEGKAYGPMDSRDDALRQARKIAEAFTDPDRQPQVWASSSSGRPSLIWSGQVRRAA